MEKQEKSQYEKLNDSLCQMKKEYESTPSLFLIKNIELVNLKLTQIESAISAKTSVGGNYKSK